MDGFRCLAVLAVMVAHYIKPIYQNEIFHRLPWGSGVTLFFVISGFLITRILLNIKEKSEGKDNTPWYSIRSFYIRRSLRIFPIYYLTLIVLYLINSEMAVKYLPWLATYTINIKMALDNTYVGNISHFWSLAVEEQFYLGWAFLIIFIPRKYTLRMIIATIIISISYKYFLYAFTDRWMGINSLTMSNMDQLGLGALLAYLFNYKNELVKKLSRMNWLLILLTIIFIFLYIFPAPETFHVILKKYKATFVAILSFLLLAKASMNSYKGVTAFLLENKVSVYIGKISYGLYIYHNLMSEIFFRFLNRILKLQDLPDYVYVLIYTAMALLVASISWFLIEKPINSLKSFFPYLKKNVVPLRGDIKNPGN
jgi:peptidoglycan/LPS O-acetylase OafA/YrhL